MSRQLPSSRRQKRATRLWSQSSTLSRDVCLAPLEAIGARAYNGCEARSARSSRAARWSKVFSLAWSSREAMSIAMGQGTRRYNGVHEYGG